MESPKNKTRLLVIFAVCIVVFNAVVFLVPFAKGAVFWISYVFGMLAIVSQLYVLKVAFSGADTVKSKLYGLPIVRIGLIYLAFQFISSMIFMALGMFVPLWIPLLVDIILLAGAVSGLIAADTVRDEVFSQDVKIKKSVGKMRSIQSRAKSLGSLCGDDAALKKAVNDLSEELRYSDPVSSDETLEMENDLSDMLDSIKELIIQGDSKSAVSLCSRMRELLVQRNDLCKLSKSNHS